MEKKYVIISATLMNLEKGFFMGKRSCATDHTHQKEQGSEQVSLTFFLMVLIFDFIEHLNNTLHFSSNTISM